MRVFVLSTGRSGTTTFFRACQHVANYTAGHETRTDALGDNRFDYPDQHIEVDNRLSWFLGGLAKRFGDTPLYVHLLRDSAQVAASFVKRMVERQERVERWRQSLEVARGRTFPAGIMDAFSHGMLMQPSLWGPDQLLDVARFYVDTVNRNIEAFIAERPNSMVFHLEEAETAFLEFWDTIEADGDLASAIGEFRLRHNAS